MVDLSFLFIRQNGEPAPSAILVRATNIKRVSCVPHCVRASRAVWHAFGLHCTNPAKARATDSPLIAGAQAFTGADKI
jgi:hypothetical protein